MLKYFSIFRERFNSFPIRKKLTFMIAGICISALLISSLAQALSSLINEKKKLVEQLSTTAKVISVQSIAALEFHDPIAADENLSSLRFNPSVILACLYDEDNQLFSAYPNKATLPLRGLKCPEASKEKNIFEGTTLKIFRELIINNQKQGTVYVEYSLNETYANLGKEWLLNLGIILVAVVIVFLLSSYFQYTISRPIMTLALKLKEFASSADYSMRVKRTSDDELGELVTAFNRMIEDIGKANYELIEEKNKAEAASKAKTEFLANMSHELRTPMNAVIGLSNIMMTMKPNKEKSDLYLKTLNESAKTLLALINDLLDFSKAEIETINLESIPFNLKEVIQEAENVIKIKANEKGVAIIVNYPANLRSKFVGDPLRISQILMNLLSNAIKFTEKGSITLDVKGMVASESSMNISIDVTDTGIGIPADRQEDIFQKFTQADASTTRKYGGTGLGLAICKKYVDAMGGEIKVNSVLGKGATFSFTIPLKIEEEGKETISVNAEIKGQPKLSHKERILLVEDHEANIILATSILEDLGYSYDIAYNGEEAVRKALLNSYDLVLMDIQMPVMDGYKAVELIRNGEKVSNREPVPIIAVTAYSHSNDNFDSMQKSLKVGMNDHISKPFQPEELRQKIEKQLKNKVI